MFFIASQSCVYTVIIGEISSTCRAPWIERHNSTGPGMIQSDTPTFHHAYTHLKLLMRDAVVVPQEREDVGEELATGI